MQHLLTFHILIFAKFEWPVISDPQGVERDYIQYPGTCVPHDAHGDTVISSDGKHLNMLVIIVSMHDLSE